MIFSELNKEELFIGFCYGMITWSILGPLSILVACCTSLNWALTGQGESKLWRRLVNPIIVSIVFVIGHNSVIPCLSIPLQFGAMSLGYGTSSTQPPDEGSWLCRLCGKWTRVAWFTILSIAMIPLLF